MSTKRKVLGLDQSVPKLFPKPAKDNFQSQLTEQKPMPCEWFPALNGLDAPCLASGGGQQGPVHAAAGANVTVLDNSPRQLEQDRFVADREGLDLRLVEGNMRNLSIYADESFDLNLHWRKS